MVLLNSEVPPQVQQRGLARTAADPLALDQSIGEVAFAGGGIVGVGATYIHAAKIAQTGRARKGMGQLLWHCKIK